MQMMRELKDSRFMTLSSFYEFLILSSMNEVKNEHSVGGWTCHSSVEF